MHIRLYGSATYGAAPSKETALALDIPVPPTDLEIVAFLLRRVGRVPRRTQIACDLIRAAMDAPFGRERQLDLLRHSAGLDIEAATAHELMVFLRRIHRLLRLAARARHLAGILTAGTPTRFHRHGAVESWLRFPRPEWIGAAEWQCTQDHHIRHYRGA